MQFLVVDTKFSNLSYFSVFWRLLTRDIAVNGNFGKTQLRTEQKWKKTRRKV